MSNANYSFPPFESFNAYTTSGPSTHRPYMPSYANEPEQNSAPLTGDPAFDILEWHPAYQSCQRYFLDHAQYEPGTQALCALINIRLPFQYLSNSVTSSSSSSSSSRSGPAAGPPNSNYSFNFTAGGSNTLPSPSRSHNSPNQAPPTFISLIPYIRRLIVTGFDKAPILHGFFGDDYTRGILPHVDCERRNYLFAAKGGGWRSCKKQYDVGSGMGGDESVPFMKPLDEAKMEELTAAEKQWSNWLAMEDWMVGPRAPMDENAEASGRTSEGRAAQHMNGNENLPDGVSEEYHQS